MSSWGGGSTFTNLPSWSDSFNTKLPSSLNTPTGGGGNMLPLALGLGSSVISGLFGMGQAKTSASIAQAQLAAQNAAMLEGREQNKGQLAGALFNKLFDVGSGGDISFQREKDAKMFEVGPYAERLMGLNSESAKRERLAAISPEAKEAALFENFLNMKRTGFENASRMEGLFGPTGFSRKFTNI